jgi:iron complex outermembrane receptor protein
MRRLALLSAWLWCASGLTAAWSEAPQEPSSSSEAGSNLEEITVTGQYIASGAESAMKQDVSVRDTPFSVSAYSASFMKSIDTTSVADMYTYMTGIQRAGNTGYDLTIRGFTSGSNDKNSILVDGLPGLSARFGSPATVGLDHTEVVKGPTSVLYGQQQPGGFINLITKKPQSKPLADVSLIGTGFDGAGVSLSSTHSLGYEASGDFTGAIDSGNRFLYRLVVDDAARGTFRTFSDARDLFIFPSLTWNVSDATSATLSFEYRRLQYGYDNYLIAPNKDYHLVAPITTLYQEPGDLETEIGRTATLSLVHSFSNNVRWRLDGRAVWHDDAANGYDQVLVRPDLLHVERRARQQFNLRRYDYLDTNLSVPFNTGVVQHKMLVGASAGHDSLDANRIQFFNGPATGPQSLDTTLYDPIHGVVPPLSSLPAVNPTTPTNLNDRYTISSTYAAYLSDLMTLTEHWKATVGLRYTREHQALEELKLPNVPIKDKDANAVVPSGGILYQPNPHWTGYVSYAGSYVPAPASSFDINGNNPFSPTKARQYETGVKGDLLDGNLDATLSLFDIEQTNVLNTFACPLGTCTQQIGQARSRGAELEVDARLQPTWQLAFGYSYTDARTTASLDPVQVDARLTNSPFNNAHLWTRYDVPAGSLQGLGFGLGVSYSSWRTGTVPSSADPRVLLLPGYTVADIGLYYTRGRYEAALRAANVLDRRYFQSAGFLGELQVTPGSPRSFTLSLRASLY